MSGAYTDTLFRQQFPEFTDPIKYPASLMGMYWGIGIDFMSADGSPCGMLQGNSLDYAQNLMTAHLYAVAQNAAKGKQVGLNVASTIDKVSVQKLAPPVRGSWDWWLNSTPYGAQLLALLESISVGGIYVGGAPESAGFRRYGGGFW